MLLLALFVAVINNFAAGALGLGDLLAGGADATVQIDFLDKAHAVPEGYGGEVSPQIVPRYYSVTGEAHVYLFANPKMRDSGFHGYNPFNSWPGIEAL